NKLQRKTANSRDNALSHDGSSQAGSLATPAEVHRELCPKCQSLIPRGVEECPKCGLLVKKFYCLQKLRDEEEQGFPASPRLRKLWASVIDRYDEVNIHQEFLKSCQAERNLVFASRQYGKILSAHHGDEMALNMRSQIMAITQLPADALALSKQPANKTLYGSFSNIIIFFSSILVVVGIFFEPWRNVVGIGVAIIFFTLAFRKR
ncbi:MAG: hypothetical protein KDD35_11735, partial [Bdellovibrionales bacterium]|nr:hypothetical protein [Bdellovibrionales bacterium]